MWSLLLIDFKFPKIEAGAHYGLPIFEEDKILFKNKTASERDKQTAALLIAKTFAQFVIILILNSF
jgi:hypothetical protein